MRRTEPPSTEWSTREDRHTQKETEREGGVREERVHQSPLRGGQSRSRAVERGEEAEEGRKVTRSARERGSGAAESHRGPSPSGTARHSNKQHRWRVILQEGIEGVV